MTVMNSETVPTNAEPVERKPLMSGTNAIHGIVLLGGLLVLGLADNTAFNKIILVIAIAFGTINVVGGFLVTDRMLEMFKGKKEQPKQVEEQAQ